MLELVAKIANARQFETKIVRQPHKGLFPLPPPIVAFGRLLAWRHWISSALGTRKDYQNRIYHP